MKKYCLDKNINEDGYYMVHTDVCASAPSVENQINLGFHEIAKTAIAQAKKLYSEASDTIKGCKECINHYLLNEE